ncbi:DDE_3 domain-containing protein [Trichonephila clavipes]|nr:DDE_3 domain-containing protein [Trichonephila clavipes]
MRSSLRFNKFITPKTIESDVWMLQVPQKSLNIANIPKSVMVWGGICANGKTHLGFVEEGAKINQKVYRRDIIEAVVLPWNKTKFGNLNWTLQQRSAPVCQAKKAQEWGKANFPDMISSEE